MEIFPFSLLKLLLYSFLFGGAIGLLYDTLRLLVELVSGLKDENVLSLLKRLTPSFAEPYVRVSKKGRGRLFGVAVFLIDVLSFVLCAFGIIILNYYYNSGEIRAFSLLSIFCGFCIYRLTLRRVAQGVAYQVIYIVRVLICVILYPFRILFGKIFRFFSNKLKKAKRGLAKRKKMRYNNIQREELMKQARSGFLNF